MQNTATGINDIVQHRDTLFNQIVVKQSPPINEDLFIIREDHLLFIPRIIKTLGPEKKNKICLLKDGVSESFRNFLL